MLTPGTDLRNVTAHDCAPGTLLFTDVEVLLHEDTSSDYVPLVLPDADGWRLVVVLGLGRRAVDDTRFRRALVACDGHVGWVALRRLRRAMEAPGAVSLF